MNNFEGENLWPQIPHSPAALHLSRAERFRETQFSETQVLWMYIDVFFMEGLKQCSSVQQNLVTWRLLRNPRDHGNMNSVDQVTGTDPIQDRPSHQWVTKWGTSSWAPTPDCWTIGSWETLGLSGGTIVFSCVHTGDIARLQWIDPIPRLHRQLWSNPERHKENTNTWVWGMWGRSS